MIDLDQKIEEKIVDDVKDKDINSPGLSTHPIDTFEEVISISGAGDWIPNKPDVVQPEADRFIV